MEMRTIAAYLNSFDLAMIEKVRSINIKYLEEFHHQFLERRQNEQIKSRNALLKILGQINHMIDNYRYYENDKEFYNEYVELRKYIIDCLIESNNLSDTEEES